MIETKLQTVLRILNQAHASAETGIFVQDMADRIAELEGAIRRLPTLVRFDESRDFVIITSEEWAVIEEIRDMADKETGE